MGEAELQPMGRESDDLLVAICGIIEEVRWQAAAAVNIVPDRSLLGRRVSHSKRNPNEEANHLQRADYRDEVATVCS
jgi:hypothetical protein